MKHGGVSVRMGEHRARKEFAVLVLVEPGAFDVEQAKAGEPGERQGVDGELRERAVGAGVGLVVENMHRAIAHLQKIDMAGDGLVGRRAFGQKPDAVVALNCQGCAVAPLAGAGKRAKRGRKSARIGAMRIGSFS